jgi:hypothetical protein
MRKLHANAPANALQRSVVRMMSGANTVAAGSRRDVPMVRSPQHPEEQAADRAEPKHQIAQLAPEDALLSSIQSHGSVHRQHDRQLDRPNGGADGETISG